METEIDAFESGLKKLGLAKSADFEEDKILENKSMISVNGNPLRVKHR